MDNIDEVVSKDAIRIGTTVVATVFALGIGYKLFLCRPRPDLYTPDGPDELSFYPPGETRFWCEPDEKARIVMSQRGPAAHAPLTVMKVFEEAVKRFPDHAALKVERDGKWQTWTWREYREDVMCCAKALISLGMAAFDSVNILGFNTPEWLIMDVGAIAAQGNAAGIYSTSTPDACKYIINHSKGVVIGVENGEQLAKILSIEKDIPSVRAIIQYTGTVDSAHKNGKIPVLSWGEFMALGKGPREEDLSIHLKQRLSHQDHGHCCTLIYTSGTTGHPKAVMISNDNITWSAKTTGERVFVEEVEEEHMVSYLPLSHIAAQQLDVHLPMYRTSQGVPMTVWFARPDALRGSLPDTIRAVKPTLFMGVPRVWEKFEEKLRAQFALASFPKSAVLAWAQSVGSNGLERAQVGGARGKPWCYGIADKVLFSKIRTALGFERCRFMLTGAAPIGDQTLRFLGSLDLHIMEVYGMSECTGGDTLNIPSAFKTGSVGRPIGGMETKLDRVEGRDPPGEGELCYRGRHIMMGYMHNVEETQKAIDEDGWLHSGDLGRCDNKGFYYVTGRIKELIVTAGGENIAPVPIENAIKEALPEVSNAMMVGDRRKFNIVLLTLRTTLNPDGTPSSTLLPSSLRISPNSITVQQAIKDPLWNKYLETGIAKANKLAVSRASQIAKFTVLEHDFSIAGGELGPTLKLKRGAVMVKYSEAIDDLYQN